MLARRGQGWVDDAGNADQDHILGRCHAARQVPVVDHDVMHFQVRGQACRGVAGGKAWRASRTANSAAAVRLPSEQPCSKQAAGPTRGIDAQVQVHEAGAVGDVLRLAGELGRPVTLQPQDKPAWLSRG